MMPTGIRSRFSDNRGVATSLIEAVLVIGIVTIIASVATGAALERIEDARFVQATSDTELIGMSVHSFMQDTGSSPAFKSGLATSPTDEIYRILHTDGSDAIDLTGSWPTDSDEKDSIENHLVRNQPGVTEPSYLRRGEISYDRHKGWNGPYLNRIPSVDPWDGRYLVNVQFLTPQGVERVREDLELPSGGRIAVVVLSAGPDRIIETRFDQISESFAPGGDDVVFRIQ
jgi:type II secretory pathway pseudopilin PulG